MSDNTLKEFLVKIKYQQDDASQAKALGGVETASKAILKLGAATVAAGVAVAAGTLKYAQGMNSTYLATQRMGMGIKEMRSMTSAAAELGTSVEDMQGSMNGFASFMRRNPMGSVDFLKGMGVDVEKGESKDKTLNKVARRFQDMPEFQAIMYGETMNLSESAVLAMRDPKYQALQAQHMDAQKGGDAQAAGKKSNEVIKSYDLMMDHFDASMTKGMIPALNEAPPLIDKMADTIDGLNPSLVATTSLFSTLGGALATVASIGLGLKGLLGLGGAATAASGASTAATAGGWMAKAASRLGGIGLLLHSSDAGEGEDAEVKKNQSMDALTANGMSKNEAAGVVANLIAESALNPKAVGDGGKAYGIAQWHQDRQNKFAELYGHKMQDSAPGKGLDEQLAFVQWELANTEKRAGLGLKANAGSARLSGEVVSRMYERPAAADRDAEKRGRDAEKIAANYTTTIHVHGVNDPEKAAELVAQKQTVVAQNNARNQQGAVR